MLFAFFLVLLPMISLAVNVAILDKLTRRTCLETSTSLFFAAIGTADAVNLVHSKDLK
jgi:hypothetical protein